nr:Unknown Function [uncultured bacterium]
MRSLTLRKAAVAAVVPLALGSLAACGNGDSTQAADPQAGGSSSPSTPSSSTTTDTGHGAKVVDPAAFVDRLKTAARSLTTARFKMTLEMAGQTVYAEGALDMTGDHPAMQISMDLTGMGTPTDMRIVDNVMYIQDPSTGGGKYFKMDLSDPNGALGDLGDTFDSYNPNQMIARMSPDSFRKVTDLGSQTVGGRQLEHYRVAIDTKAASSVFKNLPSTASLPKTMTYDMWLDGESRMAKFTLLMKKVSKVTATYADYGADVHITAPPASQITELPGATTSG